MLEQLAENDSLWLTFAMSYCKNKEEARELVQDMYIRIYDHNVDEEKLTVLYVSRVLSNMYKRKKEDEQRYFNINNNKCIHVTGNTVKADYLQKEYSLDDEDKRILDLLDSKEAELLRDNYEKSYGEMGKERGVTSKTICIKANNIRKRVLGDEFYKYKNKRLKHKR